MKQIFGNIAGLKSGQLRRLQNLYRRRIPPEALITAELVRDMARLSFEIHRQIGVTINRQGAMDHIIVGDREGIVIPDLSDYRIAPGRLRGLRCIHTHLAGEPLTQEDLNDLALLRLDMMAAATLTGEGEVDRIHAAHIIPGATGQTPCEVMKPLRPHELRIGCLDLILSLEAELNQAVLSHKASKGEERALLVSVATQSRKAALESLAELEELAESCGISVIDTIIQQRSRTDPRYLMGSGKIQELALTALQTGATLIVFDQELNPSQIRSITDRIDLKVIDRTQLILDIFAQRAQSREGRIQVELAQLKYLLPRLIVKNTAMSRLTGGIGGRGPGETKLEINRRRVRERIARLEKSLGEVRKRRAVQKSKRSKREAPVISIVGYTNAGKSTLLNTLTRSRVMVENRLFATLDPSSRRMRFPRDMEVIITDTVGFIKDLPRDLRTAFRATLEELESADLLLHVIDISNSRFEAQIRSVETILEELGLEDIPVLRVLNKMDLVPSETVDILSRTLNGVAVCAKDQTSLAGLIEIMAARISEIQIKDPLASDPSAEINRNDIEA